MNDKMGDFKPSASGDFVHHDFVPHSSRTISMRFFFFALACATLITFSGCAAISWAACHTVGAWWSAHDKEPAPASTNY